MVEDVPGAFAAGERVDGDPPGRKRGKRLRFAFEDKEKLRDGGGGEIVEGGQKFDRAVHVDAQFLRRAATGAIAVGGGVRVAVAKIEDELLYIAATVIAAAVAPEQ